MSVAQSRAKFVCDAIALGRLGKDLGLPAKWSHDPTEIAEPMAEFVNAMAAEIGERKALVVLERVSKFLRNNYGYISYLQKNPPEKARLRQAMIAKGIAPQSGTSGCGHWVLPLALGFTGGMVTRSYMRGEEDLAGVDRAGRKKKHVKLPMSDVEKIQELMREVDKIWARYGITPRIEVAER